MDKTVKNKPKSERQEMDKTVKDMPTSEKQELDMTVKDKPTSEKQEREMTVKNTPTSERQKMDMTVNDKPKSERQEMDKTVKDKPTSEQQEMDMTVKDKPTSEKQEMDMTVKNTPTSERQEMDKTVKNKPTSEKQEIDMTVKNTPGSERQEMDMRVNDVQTTERQSQNKGLGLFKGIASVKEKIASVFYRRKPVQILTPVDVPKTFSDALLDLLENISYKGENTRHEELHTDKPLIVVCPITTRLESDIDYILNGLKWSSAYITLVLHYETESSQPGLPTALRLPEKMYQLTEFIDMHFTSESRLDRYPINIAAKENIKRFLNKHYKK